MPCISFWSSISGCFQECEWAKGLGQGKLFSQVFSHRMSFLEAVFHMRCLLLGLVHRSYALYPFVCAHVKQLYCCSKVYIILVYLSHLLSCSFLFIIFLSQQFAVHLPNIWLFQRRFLDLADLAAICINPPPSSPCCSTCCSTCSTWLLDALTLPHLACDVAFSDWALLPPPRTTCSWSTLPWLCSLEMSGVLSLSLTCCER